MVKKFSVDCDFSGTKHKVDFYVGNPAEGNHPLSFQSKWLAENRHGHIPEDLMNTFSQINDISTQNKVPFEDLLEYISNEEQRKDRCIEDYNAASEFSGNQDLEQDLEADDEEDEEFKPSKKSKMQKGSAIMEQGANPLRQEQILREKYSAVQGENASSDIGEKSFKAQNPTIIEENGIKKPKRKKGEAPINDEGLQSPLKHQRDSATLNPAKHQRKQLEMAYKKAEAAKKQKTDAHPSSSRAEPVVTKSNINEKD